MPLDHAACSCTVTTRRRRLRWGDRPSNSWRRKREQAQPGLLEQLQQLKSGEEAAALGAATWQRLVQHTNNFLGRKLYEYFNWRQDTSKDLVVTFGVFSTLVLAAGAVRRWAVDYPADRAEGNLWTDVYQVRHQERSFPTASAICCCAEHHATPAHMQWV